MIHNKFKQIITTADVVGKNIAANNPKASGFQYGGLIKPKRIQNVKVPNRNLLILDGDGDRTSRHGSPSKNNDTTQESSNMKRTKSNFKRGRRGSSSGGATGTNEQSMVQNTEQDEVRMREEIWLGIEEEERLFKETLQAVQ